MEMQSPNPGTGKEAASRPRKACDLCYVRKMKCDGQQPRCSNCVTYAADCKHTAEKRKSKPKGQRCTRSNEQEEIQALQAQIQQLKAKLSQTINPCAFVPRLDNIHEEAKGSLSLPPLEEVMPMIGIFLNTVNSVQPLFHSDTLLHLVGSCYALLPHQRDPVVWSAINIVLALASQQAPVDPNSTATRMSRASKYFDKAHSVISAVMLGKIRLINIQVLVGMVMVLQTQHDLTPALIMISAAIRLIHKIGMHNQAMWKHLPPVEEKQHANVFWVAYILDKDLSMRAQQPSVQLDEDIHVAIPSPTPSTTPSDTDQEEGIITTSNGTVRMNYFLSRIQLAAIEGSIYDNLISARALNTSPSDRLQARQRIIDALKNWQASIPPEFSSSLVAQHLNTHSVCKVGFFLVLHATSLNCLSLIHQAHSWDQQWVYSLRDHGRGMGVLNLPAEWGELVELARGFMGLFGRVWEKDVWFMWMAGCTYLSAMTLLVANNLCNAQHEMIELDSRLADKGLEWLNDVAEEDAKEEVLRLRNVCMEVILEVKKRRTAAILADRSVDVPGVGGRLFSGFLNDRWLN